MPENTRRDERGGMMRFKNRVFIRFWPLVIQGPVSFENCTFIGARTTKVCIRVTGGGTHIRGCKIFARQPVLKCALAVIWPLYRHRFVANLESEKGNE